MKKQICDKCKMWKRLDMYVNGKDTPTILGGCMKNFPKEKYITYENDYCGEYKKKT